MVGISGPRVRSPFGFRLIGSALVAVDALAGTESVVSVGLVEPVVSMESIAFGWIDGAVAVRSVSPGCVMCFSLRDFRRSRGMTACGRPVETG